MVPCRSSPRSQAPARRTCAVVIKALLLCQLWSPSAAVFSHFEYSNATQSSPVQIGCMAAEYSSTLSSVGGSNSADFVIGDEPTLCTSGGGKTTYIEVDASRNYVGKVVYVKRSSCTPAAVAAVLYYLGAVGVVFGNVYPGEVPYSFDFEDVTVDAYFNYDDSTSSLVKVTTSSFLNSQSQMDIVVCLCSYDDAIVLEAQLEQGDDLQVDIQNVVESGEGETEPKHASTMVQFDWVVTKDDAVVEVGSYNAPAAQAYYNVPSMPSYTARVKKAEFSPACSNLYFFQQCLECWADDSPFANSDELEGAIVLFTADAIASMDCYYYYFELSYEAEKSGAVGVLFAHDNNVQTGYTPLGIPYDAQGNVFGIMLTTATRLAGVGQYALSIGGSFEMNATFPETDQWVPPSGPAYTADAASVSTGDESQLPEARIVLARPRLIWIRSQACLCSRRARVHLSLPLPTRRGA